MHPADPGVDDARCHRCRTGAGTIVEFMGVMGDLFPGKKLTDEGSGDSDGQSHTPRLALDLDAGVIRISSPVAPAEPVEGD